jgi:four helix bundle protein
MSSSYRDLIVWQRAIQMPLSIYRLTASFPKDEIYGLTSQLRRAAVSVPNNIAEGYGRGTRGEYKNFLGIARGSIYGVQTQLTLCQELGSGNIKDLQSSQRLADEVSKMLYSIITKLSKPKAVID